MAGDLWGGLAAMLVVLPSAIAFGVATYAALGKDYVSHGVLAGILGAIATGLLSSPLGGSPRLISAPCGPAAAVLSAFAAEMMAGSGEGGAMPAARVAALMTVVALACGVLQFFYGAIGGGKLIKFIPYPVVSGYLSGVGALIFASQIPSFLGFSASAGLRAGLSTPEHWRWQAIAVGLTTVAGILAAPKLTKAVPAPIVGLAAGLLAYFGLGLGFPEMLRQSGNPLVLGPVGGGIGAVWPHLAEQWKSMGAIGPSDWKLLLVPALTLSALLSIDTLKTCVIVDTLTRARHDSNRTLIGQGIGNVASALIGGMPGSGMMGATVVNLNSGGQTKRSGLAEGCFVLLAFVLFGNLVGWLPLAALAGVLMVVACKMFDWTSFQLLRNRSTLLDFVVIWAVIITAARFSLIAASGTGLALAVLIFLRDQIRSPVLHRKIYGNEISSKKNRLPAESQALEAYGGQTVICQLQGTLFFGTADKLYVELEEDLKRCRFMIMDMRRVLSVDFTAAHMLELIEALLRERGAFLLFSHMPATLPEGRSLEAYLHKVGVTDRQDNVKVFAELDEAMAWAEDRLLEEHHLLEDENAQRPLELAEIELFRGIQPPQDLAAIRSCAGERSVAAGGTVFQRGDRGDELFLVRRGEVRIELPVGESRHRTLAYFGRGNFFGEMGFLDSRPRSANAVATAATDLFVLRRSSFEEACRERPLLNEAVLGRMATALAARLRRTNVELRSLHDA
ncbi:MAG: SulP family inorganic anion transporter [Verrucomicrobiota bacterium]|jgi:SulP family sulfate permease